MTQPPQDLAEGLVAGRPAAFAALYDWLAPAMLRAARTMLGSLAEAEDAVQNTFLNLVRWRERLARSESLRAYVFACLRHVAAQRLARRQSEQRRMKLVAADLQARPPATAAHSGDDEALATALAKLPQEQREVIALKIDADLTFAQIGQVLGISANTAASRYRYALEKLRASLSEESP